MDLPKYTTSEAREVMKVLRAHSGAPMTLRDIADEMELPVEELTMHLEALSRHGLILKETAAGWFDIYRAPDEYESEW